MVELDFAVFSPDEQLVLVVEVKNHPGASAEWAAQFRRNLLAHSILPRGSSFLLALPDRLFLWRDAQGFDGSAPDYQIETAEALWPFVGVAAAQTAGEEGLELAVSAWLDALTSANLQEDEASRRYRWLVDSGLYQRIHGGHVQYRKAAAWTRS